MPYDAIIVGSRIAGSATGMLLARHGFRVLVVDRTIFPSDTISTHIVWQHGVNWLIDWGLGDAVSQLGAPAIERMTFDFGAFSLTGTIPAVGRARYAYAPRRMKLDPMLVAAAADAGAEVRHGFTVEEIVFDGDRVAGIRGRDRSGASVTEHAKVVIGADGLYSTVARTVKPFEYNSKLPLACWYYSYWSGLRRDTPTLYSRPHITFGAIPTNDGLACLAVAWPQHRFPEIKTDVERHYLAALDAAPEFKEEVVRARREERFYGTGYLPSYYRKPYGQGWALVGDAGYHKDPVLGQGISDALRDSGLLVQALQDVFSGVAAWDTAMERYEMARNVAVKEIYEMNAAFASLEPPAPEIQTVLEALPGNAKQTSRWLGVITGAVLPSEFYTPENVATILDSAQAERRADSARHRTARAVST
jgi:2-polyprenyl-6-methoxyphenol hydroxylase-like FAD-dependent oxidoreductase